MDEKNYETRHVFMVSGVCIFFFSPILLLFVPQTVANSLHYSEDLWYVFVSGRNFIIYGIGFLFIFLSSMLLFILDIPKVSIVLSFTFVISGFSCFLIASQSYISFTQNSISYRPIFSMKDYSYSWNELDTVVLVNDKSGGYSEYKYIFKDGNSMKLRYNNYFRAIQKQIYGKLHEINLEIQVEEIP